MKKFLFFAMLLGAINTYAQTTTEQEAQIAQLQEEVAILKEKSKSWDKITKALPKISGYTQIRYSAQGGEDGSSTFRLRRVRLTLDGNISPKVDYKLQAELTSFKLLDAYFSYKPAQEFSIRAGQFKLPFSIENTDYGPTKLEFIDYPMALTYLVGYDEAINGKTIKANGRDLGAKFYGAFGKNKVIGYDIGVFNGNGLNTTDNNKSKDFVGRLSIRPVKGLLISGSYMWGEYDSSFYARERWGFGVCYDRGNVVARTEYIGGRTGRERVVGGTTPGELSDGWYVMAGYRFCKNWMVAARYDTFTEDSDARDESTTSTITGGLTWQPVKHFKLQANYVFTDWHRFAGAGKDTHCLQIQAAAMF